MGLNFLSCASDYPPASENWFATQIFQYDNSVIDQFSEKIYLLDENTGIILGNDEEKVLREGKKEKDQTAVFFRSIDGGRSFERRDFGNGYLKYISLSTDKKSLYMLCARFTEYNAVLPSNFQLMKSVNSGETWEDLYLFKEKLISKVLFYDDSIGFASALEDPIGYDSAMLYKTVDGGKSWRPVFQIDMDNKSLNLITPEGMLTGQYLDDPPAVWQSDIRELKEMHRPLDFSDDLRICSDIQPDPVTGRHYCMLMTRSEHVPEKDVREFLYCIETGETLPLPVHSFHFNVYGDYIGVLGGCKDNYYIAQYYYSYDKGRYWETETPRSIRLSGSPGLYGKGYVWSMFSGRADDIYCPLMVRIPPQE
jgi:hypothetical protein